LSNEKFFNKESAKIRRDFTPFVVRVPGKAGCRVL